MTPDQVIAIVQNALRQGRFNIGRAQDLSGPADPNGRPARKGALYRRTGPNAGVYINKTGAPNGWKRLRVEGEEE